MGTSLKGNNLFPMGVNSFLSDSVPYGMEKLFSLHVISLESLQFSLHMCVIGVTPLMADIKTYLRVTKLQITKQSLLDIDN